MSLKIITLRNFIILKPSPISTNKTFYGKMSKRTSTSVSQPFMIPETPVKRFITHWLQQYEDFIGITAVKQSQNKVIMAENKFQETQESRRDVQRKIHELQSKLKEIHRELDKTSRGEDRYLHLITQEHIVIKDEKTMLDEFRMLEKDERDYFSALSLAVRESHEQERTQAERTKYWSVIGSICGAVIGIVGTTISNRMRMKELRQLVTDASNKDSSTLLAEQQTKLESFLTDIKQMLIKTEEAVNDKTDGNSVIGNEEIEAMEKRLAQEMHEVKALITAQLIPSSRLLNEDEMNKLTPVNVYFGEDLGKIVQKAEKNLEWKMKINSLATVAAFYGVFAITVPIIFHLFKGN